ncbi:MAG: hypothetical protein CM15mP47_2310 [Methanobacteriota archaeon]|nr:MAG: hypothetical protein CM15mP47_2310 [Euryarchaeota archaeon]
MGLDSEDDTAELDLVEETGNTSCQSRRRCSYSLILTFTCRTHAKMPVTDDAVREAIDTYYMVVEN